MKRRYRVPLSGVKTLAKTMATELRGGETLALIGQLGSGKTTFVQTLARALGVRQKVLSPTFIVLQEFPTRLPTKHKEKVTLLHLDLYRTASFKDLKALGLDQRWQRPQTITVIEWADKIKRHLPANTIYLYLHRDVS